MYSNWVSLSDTSYKTNYKRGINNYDGYGYIGLKTTQAILMKFIQTE